MFTDKHLEQLKEKVGQKTGSDGVVIDDETAAWMRDLLARLDAAERVAEACAAQNGCSIISIKQWRTASGKDVSKTVGKDTTASKVKEEKNCAHINFYGWYNCPKSHVEPDGMGWRSPDGKDSNV